MPLHLTGCRLLLSSTHPWYTSAPTPYRLADILTPLLAGPLSRNAP
jgi:hypothetical protein